MRHKMGADLVTSIQEINYISTRTKDQFENVTETNKQT